MATAFSNCNEIEHSSFCSPKGILNIESKTFYISLWIKNKNQIHWISILIDSKGKKYMCGKISIQPKINTNINVTIDM